jgi:hypothetical protein
MEGYTQIETALLALNILLGCAILVIVLANPGLALAVVVCIVVHPIEFAQIFWHASKTHPVEVVCVNFRFGAVCEGCGRVFLDE